MAMEKTMAAAKTDPSPGYKVDDADESKKKKKMMMMIEGEGSESVDDDDEYVDVWVLRTVRDGPVKVWWNSHVRRASFSHCSSVIQIRCTFMPALIALFVGKFLLYVSYYAIYLTLYGVGFGLCML